MGREIQCFLLEPTEQCDVSLRRFRFSAQAKCPGPYGYHNHKTAAVERLPYKPEVPGQSADYTGAVLEVAKSEPRWPAKCAHCSYVFVPDDQWQTCAERLYRRSDTGELVTMAGAPPGAMWFADWLKQAVWDDERYRAPDGHVLAVRTPGGDWIVDGPASNGPGWTREGEPPYVTVRPSIKMGDRYHGFLTNGVLRDC
jgi:hypothetical protein